MAVAAEMNRPAVKAAFIIPTNRLVKAWSELYEQAIPSCPYRGLFAFREEDAGFFFGREKFTEQLVAAVQRQPLVAVIGPSGSGKSSVVFAGLISQLRCEQTWLIESFRPGERPFRNLASSLVPLLETQMSETDQLVEINKLAMAFGQGNISLQDVVTRILEKHSSTGLLLVADQFEELYTLCRDGSERQEFLACLLEAVNYKPSFTLVLTLRADFLGYALSYRPFADALQNADVKLGPMNRQELQDAIAKPAQKQGVKMEQGLIERILDAVGEEPGNLPLLEFALTQLWEKQTNGKLTHAAYDAIGGVEQALSNHAEEVYGQLSAKEQKQAQRIFIQLVRPGEGTADTRRQATRTEVGEENWGLVKRLADERLVVSDRKKTAGEAEEETVEIVHEALIREWSRLRQWMKDDRAFRLWQERLRAVMHYWETANQDEGALLRGSLLAEAEAWQQKRSADLSEAERDFILLSLALRDRDKDEREQMQQRELALVRQARSRLRWLVAVLGTIALGTTGVLAYPYILSRIVVWQAKMIRIPPGSATIGTDNLKNNPDVDNDEMPQWRTTLPAFKIEQFEVSNHQYHLCVKAGACNDPVEPDRFYYNPHASNYPVVGVTAVQAAKYCRWLGRRLPNELEWERVARGSKGRLWPWGDESPTWNRANILFDGEPKGPKPVTEYLFGRSPENVYNLVGNVWEWTASYYHEIASYAQKYEVYKQELVWNGRPETLRPEYSLVIRGGGWEDSMKQITRRDYASRSLISPSIGIRCASDL